MTSDEQSSLVTVYSNDDIILVNIARDLLISAGIETYIFDAETPRMLAIQGRAAVPPRLMVYADRAGKRVRC